MTPTETATILRQFNEWRRGDEDIPQFDPREIGEAIDAAVEMIERLELAESSVACRTHSELHDILSANAMAIRARGDA